MTVSAVIVLEMGLVSDIVNDVILLFSVGISNIAWWHKYLVLVQPAAVNNVISTKIYHNERNVTIDEQYITWTKSQVFQKCTIT